MDTPSSSSGHNPIKRLSTDLMTLMTKGDEGISAFPNGDNMFHWLGTIHGSGGTVYESLEFRLSFKFPQNYPLSPPTVKFETPCFHPNVDVHGNICLDILQDKWSSVYDVRSTLLSLRSLLGEPNNDSPLNSTAAGLWENQEEFRKMVLKTHKEVSVSGEEVKAK
eukprot:CAMPEP_0175826236 /NCGR_PEP_ID=MMETSP0107_2-20121207/11664_1 /TAXON_ID=195067 ORGANISM="Goniomonas pacifica, Strain CCMP1869" /NCGR_SAMPLE_ID=MMETSP0107_2 /ASSEMBLY_ACC=CAM_ASM_000203 /LENGTH=164 /DNA_ID=CAMNT_0017138875 /DNA_START=9 /DNA_END=503 /DNA_ORIENTATION=-